MTDPFDAWLDAVLDRHTRALTRPEFLKAVRALSARYVERRSALPGRQAADSPGKRAAFAAFFAPLHFVTTRHVIRALQPASTAPLETVFDLGCGTGVTSAAWALEHARRPALVGVDRDGWALREATWTWRTLGLEGRTRREDVVSAATRPTTGTRDDPAAHARGFVLGWSVNELAADVRDRLLQALAARAAGGAAILIIEPIARSASPWWSQWVDAFGAATGRRATSHELRFDAPLPPRLAELSHEAGFRRDTLAARALWIPAGG